MPTQADVLIITVTKVESQAVLRVFEEATGQPAQKETVNGRVYRHLGEINGARVLLGLSGMGAGGLGGSQQAITRSIESLHPAAVVMVGIGFGVNETKQAIGDVLVSEHLRLYDLQRIGTPAVILRGSRPDASPWLLSYLKSADIEWDEEKAKIRFGLVMSGDKLVDNVDYRDHLIGFEPEAIGGEMEGAGLYAACQDAKVDWILVKAICDWADGDKETDKTARQKLAAINAAAFVLHALQHAKLTPSKRENPSSSGLEPANITRNGVRDKNTVTVFDSMVATEPRIVTQNELYVRPFDPTHYAPKFDQHLSSKGGVLLLKLNELRVMVDRELRRIPPDEYSGSTSLHCREVIRMQASMFPDLLASHLSEHELFLLGASAVAHDWGMVPRSNYSSDVLYREHPDVGANYILQLKHLPYREEVSAICEIHNRDLTQAKDCLENIRSEANLPLIYCMLRVADTIEIKMQSPSLSGGIPATTARVIGTFTLNAVSRLICVTRNLSVLDERKFELAVKEVARILDDCNQVLRPVHADYRLVV